MGLSDEVIFSVESDGVSFFKAEGLMEIVSEIDRSGSKGIHDGLLFAPVRNGNLSLHAYEEDGAVLFLPLNSAGELRQEVVDGDDLALGKFVNRVLGHGLFRVSAFFDLPEFFTFGKEEDVEA